jgi:hypothetical protein
MNDFSAGDIQFFLSRTYQQGRLCAWLVLGQLK